MDNLIRSRGASKIRFRALGLITLTTGSQCVLHRTVLAGVLPARMLTLSCLFKHSGHHILLLSQLLLRCNHSREVHLIFTFLALTAALATVGEDALAGTRNDRSVHVLERNVSRQVLQDTLIHDSSIALALFVLGIDSIFGFFDACIFELFKVVVFITLILIFLLLLLLVDEGECLVVHRDVMIFTLVTIANRILVLFIDSLQLLFDLLIISRFAVL